MKCSSSSSSLPASLVVLLAVLSGVAAAAAATPVRRTVVDLRAKMRQASTTTTSVELVNIASLSRSSLGVAVSSSRLHSSQLNESQLATYFTVANKTSVRVLVARPSSTPRAALCSQLAHCTHTKSTTTTTSSTPPHTCLFDVTLLVYLSNSNSNSNSTAIASHHHRIVSEVRPIKLSLIVSDLTTDYLHFERLIYEFGVDVSEEEEQLETKSVGSVRARLHEDAELDSLVKYYAEFRDVNERRLYSPWLSVDESSGRVSVKRRALSASRALLVEFYVDAFVQCALGQRPLHNRTLVRLTLRPAHQQQHQQHQHSTRVQSVNTSASPYTIRTLALIESTSGQNVGENGRPRCTIRLSSDDLTSDSASIALAQLRIERNVSVGDDQQQQQPLFEFGVSVEPAASHGLLNLTVGHLVDNIHVLYLHAGAYRQRHLVDIFKLSVRMRTTGSDNSDAHAEPIFVCIGDDQQSANNNEQASLISFDHEANDSLAHVVNVVATDDSTSHFRLALTQLTSSAARPLTVDVQLAWSNQTSTASSQRHFVFVNDLLDNYNLSVVLPSASSSSSVQRLQHEFELVVLNSNHNETYNTNDNDLLSPSFVRRVLVNSQVDTRVEDDDATSSSSSLNYTFRLLPAAAGELNGSLAAVVVVGYLPDARDWYATLPTTVYDIFYQLDDETSTAQQCFRLNKYDGTLTSHCAAHQQQNTTKLGVNVMMRSKAAADVVVWRHISVNVETAAAAPPTHVSIVYEAAGDQLNKSTISATAEFDLSFRLNHAHMHNASTQAQRTRFVRLANILTATQLNYTTRFELITNANSSSSSSSHLFAYDSKRAALYLNTSHYYRTMVGEREYSMPTCHSLSLGAKHYEQLDARSRRPLTPMSGEQQYDALVTLHLCLEAEWSHGRPLLTPVLSNRHQDQETTATSFAFLIKSHSQSALGALSRMRVGSLALVAACLAGLVSLVTAASLVVCVLVQRRHVGDSKDKPMPCEKDLTVSSSCSNEPPPPPSISSGSDRRGRMYECVASASASVSSSSASTTTTSGFKSAPSVSSQLWGTNIAYIYSNEKVTSRALAKTNAYSVQQVGLVGDELDVIEDDDAAADDHGVYCLVTSYSSNISSVTTSQCVDEPDMHEMALDAAAVSPKPKPLPLAAAVCTEATATPARRLSLFDMTPTINKTQTATTHNPQCQDESEKNMLQWVSNVNYNIGQSAINQRRFFNHHRPAAYTRPLSFQHQVQPLSAQQQQPQRFAPTQQQQQLNSTNECII